MPLCYQCEWNDRPASDAKTRACVACPGPGEWLTHKGRVHVSIDAGAAQTAAEVEASNQARARTDDEGFDENDPAFRAGMEAGGARVLLYFKELTKEQVVLLYHFLNSGSLAGAAEKLGRTRAMLSKLWRSMLDERPELAAVLDGTNAAPDKGQDAEAGAKSAEDAAETLVQGELF